jgi:hypothetical protein
MEMKVLTRIIFILIFTFRSETENLLLIKPAFILFGLDEQLYIFKKKTL